MRTALLFALIFTGLNAGAQDSGPVGANRLVPASTTRIVRSTAVFSTGVSRHAPNPGNIVTVEGVLPRVAAADNPLEMINPFAPPQYGSARGFVVYTEQDPRTENKNRFQPNGIRLLTIRPLW